MSAITAGELQQRLSEQLQALSQVGETLTLRLLELEERLAGLEDQLQNLQTAEPGAAEGQSEITGELLAATEERIARLEELLSEQPFQPGGRPSAPIPLHGTVIAAPELEADPFPEEEEQPFMDELSA